MYHVKSASMKVSQMKASRSFRWKFSASQLIITRNVRALFFFFPCIFQASLSVLIDRVVFHQLILLNLHLEQKLSENDVGSGDTAGGTAYIHLRAGHFGALGTL